MNEKNLHQIPHDCLLNLQAVYGSLKSAEKKAADLMLEDPAAVTGMKVADFSEQAGCSEATIVRLAKDLGYEGFPELKNDFRNHMSCENNDAFENISGSDNPELVLRKVFDTTISALNDTIKITDLSVFTEAAESVNAAENILFCGVGDAGIVATEAQQRFLRIGKRTVFSLDPDTQLINASQLKKGDVVVAISYSGRSRTVIDTVKVAKEAGAEIIAITNFPVSPLTKKADYVLQTAVFSKSVGNEIIAKRVTALCIVESLFLLYLFGHKGESLKVLEKSNKIVDINKQ